MSDMIDTARTPVTVSALAIAPVKSLRLSACSELLLERGGAPSDRRFYIVDARGRRVNGVRLGALNAVLARFDEGHRVLTLTFPDGEVVSAPVELGAEVQTTFSSASRSARELLGPFSAALSAYAGEALRIVAPEDGRPATDRGDRGAVTLYGRASLAPLERLSGREEIDPRRFRMTIELATSEPHEEDAWVGRELTIGDARIRVSGHVGRCIVTCRHPDSGELDLPTLDLLRAYRSDAATTEPLAFGIYGAVVEPGLVRVGDEVQVD
jgi:uncharacterized protein YcbX